MGQPGTSSSRWLTVVVVWLIIVGAGAVSYKLMIAPWLATNDARQEALAVYEKIADQARQRGIEPDPIPDDASPEAIAQQTRVLEQRLTGSHTTSHPLPANHSQLKRIKLGIDSFSGYSVFRSDAFHNELATRGIGLDLVDDGADYAKRLRAVRDGRVPLALFTIDALIAAGAAMGDSPGTVVMVVDETIGADAMVAYKQGVANINDLNHPEARIVTTRQSPSETLARVVIANFRLPELPTHCWIDAGSAQDVYQQFRDADPKRRVAYALWEPFVSRALDEVPGTHVLIDSSRFRGYIVDVLVAQRQFLLDDEPAVRAVVEAYLRTVYEQRRQPNGLTQLVQEDASRTGQPVTDQQAQRLAQGIWWKTTQDNYSHMGVTAAAASSSNQGLQTLDAIITNMTDVLVRTGAIPSDPTGGQPHSLYYDGVFRQLYAENFHPALVRPAGGDDDADAVRVEVDLPPLTDPQWQQLVSIGTLRVDRIVFARGTATLTGASRLALERLGQTLRSWPQCYLLVRGHARREGDADANRLLATQRAEAAAKFMVDLGIAPDRVRAVASDVHDTGGQAQSVTFILGQTPY